MARPKNSTEFMTQAELRELLEDAGFPLSMAAPKLGLPYRTLQDYALGNSGIPEAVAGRVRAFHKDWKEYMAEWRRGLEERIDREFPNGI